MEKKLYAIKKTSNFSISKLSSEIYTDLEEAKSAAYADMLKIKNNCQNDISIKDYKISNERNLHYKVDIWVREGNKGPCMWCEIEVMELISC